MSHSEDNKRIAKNTLYLYLRSIFTMAVSLYTSRLILQVLGFTDHGIYNLIGSVVVMFNMFSATFVASTQRFLNFALGRNDINGASRIFSASINIHTALAVAIILLLETVGLWFLNNKLNIPIDRIIAANAVYQCSVLTFVINLFCIPFNAVVIAKEKMQIFAIVTVFESVAKLLIVNVLSILDIDRLILYGILLAFVSCAVLSFYYFYCKKHFIECHYQRFIDRTLYKEMLGISGWNFLGSSASIVTISGMGVIINIFTNVVVNSAKGIASQVETVIKQLVDNFMASIRPQITKSYASEDYDYLVNLIYRGTKFSSMLMCALCLPIFFNVDYILSVWLREVPEYTDSFIQLMLIYILMIPFSNILDNLLMASGKIKQSQITLSIVQLMNLPFSCLILYMRYPPYIIYLSYILLSYVSFAVRLYYSKKCAKLNLYSYTRECLFKTTICIVTVFVMSFVIMEISHIKNGPLELVKNCFIIEMILIVSYAYIVFSNKERKYIVSVLKNKIIKRNGHN